MSSAINFFERLIYGAEHDISFVKSDYHKDPEETGDLMWGRKLDISGVGPFSAAVTISRYPKFFLLRLCLGGLEKERIDLNIIDDGNGIPIPDFQKCKTDQERKVLLRLWNQLQKTKNHEKRFY